MNEDEFQTVGLYEHNAKCYKEVKKAYESGENVVGIVHATGTGKSYNALQLAYDNKDKKIVYIVPSNGIIEHIEKIISNNPNLDFKRDFPNLELRTYQSLVSLSKEELKKIECNILIIDEFHHMGAPIWGAQVKAMIETHEDIKIFGMTAYTVRDRNTPYERDMANPNTNELFSNKIVSRYDLCDAMMDGILPIPVYKSSYITIEDIEDVENRLDKSLLSKEECKKYKDMLLAAKERIHEAKSIPKVISKNIKPNGKYIYFCPPYSETGVNDIEAIKAQAMNWFKQITEEDNIEFYTSTSQMGKEGIKNREAFYEDKTTEGEDAKDKLRVMFAINQYNEGIHAPNVDGVILGRATSSDIVFFEQIGRGLAVRGDVKEKFEQLAQYSKKELEEMCKSREIEIKENYTKEDLIERLIAPTIIDLSNNFRYIKELENNLKNRVREAQNRKVETNPREIKIKDVSFDIEMEDQDFYEMLEDIKERLLTPWEEMYEYAKIYYEHYNDLEVPARFRTNDGYTYEEDGKIGLGQWISSQRRKVPPESEQGHLLTEIGMRFETRKRNTLSWEEMYGYAKIYYEHYNNLEVPQKFRTNDGYTYEEYGKIRLGQWVKSQRQVTSQESEKGYLLTKIGMRFGNKNSTLSWKEMYGYAKIYYEHYNDLEVPQKFRTNDGYTYEEDGKIRLGQWISSQRQKVPQESDQGHLLTKIGMRFETKKISTLSWEEMYEYARIYYEHYNDLEVSQKFRTNDGYTYEEDGKIRLGQWIRSQRQVTSKESEKGYLLTEIGMRFGSKNSTLGWKEMYEYAKIYYEHYNDLEVPTRFRTNDGYTYEEDGKIRLGNWISSQRQRLSQQSKRGHLLSEIGMRFENKNSTLSWKEMYEYAKIYYEHYNNLEVPFKFMTNDGYTPQEEGKIRLGQWISSQRRKVPPESEQGHLLTEIGMRFETKRNTLSWEETYEYAKIYYEHYNNLEVPQKFRTNDGYTYEEDGKIGLGNWISSQRRVTSKESEKGYLLTKIGMCFETKNSTLSWEEMYEYAKIYYEHYNDLEVPARFRTNDGYTYEENGKIRLGLWIINQRQNIPQKSEKIQALDEIKMNWSPRIQKEEVNNLCIDNEINIELNKTVISHISAKELKSKTTYLRANGIELTNEDGKLHEIFSMSSPDMKEKYGISLPEMIRDFYDVKQKRK